MKKKTVMLVAGGLALLSRDSDVTQPATRKGPSKSAAMLKHPISSQPTFSTYREYH
jgi:hypothetical protein